MSKFPPFFPRPDCLPIRRRVQNGGRFGYLPNTFPSRIIIVCGIRVAETPTRKSIDTHYEEPTSPLRPTARGRAEGAFFVSDFSRASKRHIRGEGGQRRPQMAARSRGRRRRTETPADGRAVAGRLAPWWTASLVAVAAIASAGWLARRPSTSLSEVVSGNGGFYTCVTRGSGAARAQRAP
jgi:hypothetical protein